MRASLLFALAVLCGAPAGAGAQEQARRVATPRFLTEIVAFEDNFQFARPNDGRLIYRTVGAGSASRSPGRLLVAGGPIEVVHVAQYDRPTLRVRMRIDAGEPAIAVCHNGMADRAGEPAASRGVELVLGQKATFLRELSSLRVLTSIPAVLPRGKELDVAIAWNFEARSVRVDLPAGSFLAALPRSVTRKGGFALRAGPGTRYAVSRIQVLWQDNRRRVLYDGYESIFDLDGKPIARLPSPKLPLGMTRYMTAAVDMRRERALIAFGGPDFILEKPETLKGFAVRELATGMLALLGPTVNGCLPLQGGGSMDGYWLLQSWNPPASTCWLDWSAYAAGKLDAFVRPAMTGHKVGAASLGFHDPANALDGSMARYLRITEDSRGVNHLAVHPNLVPYAPFDDMAMPRNPDPLLSHTGPAGLPTQLAVRDRDRAWYEIWAYGANCLHTQLRGYNLFAGCNDWAGPSFPTSGDAPVYSDYANPMPDLVRPGHALVGVYRFAAMETGAARIQQTDVRWVVVRPGKLAPEGSVGAAAKGALPFQILLSRRCLNPLPTP